MKVEYIELTEIDAIKAKLDELGCRHAHFTNGTYALDAKLIVPTTLAGFKHVVRENNDTSFLVIAVNSDISMRSMALKFEENQSERAAKVAEPLSELFPDKQVVVLYYDKKTPNELYQALHQEGITQTLHKWGYGTKPDAAKIEGTEYFKDVYGFPLPNDGLPVCYSITPVSDTPQAIKVVDLRQDLIAKEGLLFEVPEALQQYLAPKKQVELEKSNTLLFKGPQPSTTPVLTPVIDDTPSHEDKKRKVQLT